MVRNVLVALLIAVPITLLSVGLVVWRAEAVAGAEEVAAKGLAAVRSSLAGGWLVAGLIFGVMAMLVYRWMLGRWAAEAPRLYLGLAGVLIVALSMLAVVALPMLKRHCLAEYIALHLLWGLGYGWLIPQVIR